MYLTQPHIITLTIYTLIALRCGPGGRITLNAGLWFVFITRAQAGFLIRQVKIGNAKRKQQEQPSACPGLKAKAMTYLRTSANERNPAILTAANTTIMVPHCVFDGVISTGFRVVLPHEYGGGPSH